MGLTNFVIRLTFGCFILSLLKASHPEAMQQEGDLEQHRADLDDAPNALPQHRAEVDDAPNAHPQQSDPSQNRNDPALRRRGDDLQRPPQKRSKIPVDVESLQRPRKISDGESPPRRPNRRFDDRESRPEPVAPQHLALHPDCRDDVQRICEEPVSSRNNFAVLDCLQRDPRQRLSDPCSHIVWTYKRNLTRDVRFDAAAFEVCRETVDSLPECSALEKGTGQIVSCLIDNVSNVTKEQCAQFLRKMEALVFADYRLVNKFVDKCGREIEEHKCGRVSGKQDKLPHRQGETIACLQGKIGRLAGECRKEILRISELQADDYHLDRQLFFACREDRERFCPRVGAGNGQIYKCLMRRKFDAAMSAACRAELARRQKLVSEDWKVNRGLVSNCRADVKHHMCLNQPRAEALTFKQGKLSIIVLCLENAMREGLTVSQECQAELFDVRKQLMEDFSITPEIVTECSKEIKEECSGMSKKGRTLHCLMDLMSPRKKDNQIKLERRISQNCKREMSKLLKEADVGSDFRIDTMLQEMCQPVVETACRDIRPGDARIITCLLEKLDTDHMIAECEERLLEIQYFITRDWKMDPRIHRKCRSEAKKLCHAEEAWKEMNTNDENIGEEQRAHQGYVLACLFRYADNEKSELVSRGCDLELRRAMKERAISVHLQPELEDPCLLDLGKYCSSKVEKGMEIDCLQNNFEKLSDECRKSVEEVTEREADDIELDRILVKECSPIINRFCKHLLEAASTDEGRLMECLIAHKNQREMSEKCAAGVLHFQLTSMKQVTFNYKFKTACKQEVMNHCKQIKNKIQAVGCLSEVMRNDTLLDKEHRLSAECRDQLRVELLQRNEDVRLDPELQKSCADDLKLYCDFPGGGGKKIKCLRQRRKSLKPECHRVLFSRDAEISKDNSVDFALVTICKSMKNQYCEAFDDKNILDCLKRNMENPHFDSRCRKIVLDRMRMQKLDYRLNPNLEKACEKDIPKYCKSFIKNSAPTEYEGVVIKCLKKQFTVPKRLSDSCTSHIKLVIEEAQSDYKQDPILMIACENEIRTLCGTAKDEGHGKVEECLKENLNKIRSKKCKVHVADLVKETQVDIEVDPLLHKACASDILQFCPDVPAGDGQQMMCVLAALDDSTISRRMTPDCKKKLQDRRKMWELAARVAPPESIADVVETLQSSPSKDYFLVVVVCVLLSIFVVGLFCGKYTRLHRQAKDR